MRNYKTDFLQLFRPDFLTLLLSLLVTTTALAQPGLKVILKDSVTVTPARPNDTVFYKLDIENISNEDIKQLLLNRSGDSNTTFVPGSFKSTPIAIPLSGLVLSEDQIATITLVGLDPDGDPLTFTIIQAPQNGVLSGLNPSSITESIIDYQPNTDFIGNDLFSFAVEDDDGNRDTSLIELIIQSVNDAPNFTANSDISMLEDAGAQAIPWATDISAGPTDESGQALTFNILSNNNTDLFENQPEIASDGTLTFTAKADANGEAELVVQLMDNGGTSNGGVDTSLRQTLLISVLPVNDAPNFTANSDISMLEDAGAQAIPWATDISAGPMDESGQALTFNILSNNNADLFENQPQIASDGTLTFTAKADANGEAELVVQLIDNGGTSNGGVDTSLRQTLLISVLPVNDAPGFVKGADISIETSTELQTFANWVSDITLGPADEALQTLTFIIESNDNEALFEIQPAITSDGTLTFKANQDAVGIANIIVKLQDNGGVENGGVDTSTTQSFTITLTPSGG